MQIFVFYIVAPGHALIALALVYNLIGLAQYDSTFNREQTIDTMKKKENGIEIDPTRALETEDMIRG